MAELSFSINDVHWKNSKFRFAVFDPEDEIQKFHASGNLYEADELSLIIASDRNWKHMVDVGANVGNHCIALNGVFNFQTIDVFEPNPTAAEMLRVNIVLNTPAKRNPYNLENMSYVLSNTLGGAFFGEEKFSNNLGSMHFIEAATDNLAFETTDQHGDEDHISQQTSVKHEPVFSTTLDYALGSSTLVDFLKIDVEGMEMEVLDGACATISRLAPDIYIEVADENEDLIRKFLDTAGYHVHFHRNMYPGLQNLLLFPIGGRDRT